MNERENKGRKKLKFPLMCLLVLLFALIGFYCALKLDAGQKRLIRKRLMELREMPFRIFT